MDADPLELLVGWLRAQPDITVPVADDLTGHNPGDPLIMVDIAGGYETIRNVMDRWDVVIHYHGPDNAAIRALALNTRKILLNRLPASRVGAVVVSDVTEGHAPSNNTDPQTGEQRYLHIISVFLY